MNKLLILALGLAPVASMATLFDFNNATPGFWSSVSQTVDGITATATGVGDNLTVINWGGSPVVVGGSSGAWKPTRVDFSTPMSSVSAMFGDGVTDDDDWVVLSAYDAGNNLVDQQLFYYGTMTGWATLTVNAASILYVIGTTTAQTNPNSVVWDNFSAQPVPEPTTMAALGLGVAALMRRRARK